MRNRRLMPSALMDEMAPMPVVWDVYEFVTVGGEPLFLQAGAEILAAEGLGDGPSGPTTRIHVRLGVVHPRYGAGGAQHHTWEIRGTPEDVRSAAKALYEKIEAEAEKAQGAYERAMREATRQPVVHGQRY